MDEVNICAGCTNYEGAECERCDVCGHCTREDCREERFGCECVGAEEEEEEDEEEEEEECSCKSCIKHGNGNGNGVTEKQDNGGNAGTRK